MIRSETKGIVWVSATSRATHEFPDSATMVLWKVTFMSWYG